MCSPRDELQLVLQPSPLCSADTAALSQMQARYCVITLGPQRVDWAPITADFTLTFYQEGNTGTSLVELCHAALSQRACQVSVTSDMPVRVLGYTPVQDHAWQLVIKGHALATCKACPCLFLRATCAA